MATTPLVCRFCGAADTPVIRRWHFEIFHLKVPSQNAFKKMHYHVYRKMREAWTTAFQIAARPLALGGVCHRRVLFTRVFCGRQRLMDHANFVGGMKPVVDSMVRAGLLTDDSPKYFSGYYRQRRAPLGESARLDILVEEI